MPRGSAIMFAAHTKSAAFWLQGIIATVTRCDIDDCFEHIPRWEVVRLLREVVADVAVVDLVCRLMGRPVIGERIARPDRGLGLGLHQGSPLSPLLCHLYLDGFDRAMLASGYRSIRYSDDIAIPVPDRGAAERALSDAAWTSIRSRAR
jgi:retron-type reverse transcriptase